MLYDLNLDDKSFREIEADAVFQIPKECPEWTNYNPSDPGIMLLQLLAWLKEVQQYHIDQSAGRKRRKYLKLLGYQIRHIRPAFGSVHVEPGLEQAGGRMLLLEGTRFFAGDMPFETVEPEWVQQVKLLGAYTLQNGRICGYQDIVNEFDKQMKLFPFGQQPQEGNQCCFALDGALDHTCKCEIYFDICTVYEVARNPVTEGFVPLAELRWEYRRRDGWKCLQIEADHTCGLVQSGSIRFRMDQEMEQDETVNAYLLRVTLETNEYDVAPLIQNIYLNETAVKQQFTCFDYEDLLVQADGKQEISVYSSRYLAAAGKFEVYLEHGGGFVPITGAVRRRLADRVEISFPKPDWAQGTLTCRLAAWEEDMQEKQIAGMGDSFASQDCILHIPSIIYDAFEIMVYDPAGGVFRPYRKVEDFDNCGPEDAVYILDLDENMLRFGDCEKGMAPGGEIRILRLKTSLGRAGNVKAGMISRCGTFPELLVRQLRPAQNGRDNESVEECYARLRRHLKTVQRGVTYGDYEELVKKAPGLLILDSRVIPPTELAADGKPPAENLVSIVVHPLSYKKRSAKLSPSYRRNLLRLLNRRKLLGTRIQLLNPEYIGVLIYAEIVIKPHFQDAEARIAQAVREYLDEKSWKIGAPVRCSTLYGIIDTLSCVWHVQTLSADAVGKGCRRLTGGDVALPPNGLAYLEDLDIHIYTAD